MNKITKLTFKKNLRFPQVNIFINDQWAFSSPLDLIGKWRLAVGQELSDSELTNYKHQAQFEYYYQRSLSYLSIRPRSTKEIRLYLIKLMNKSDKLGKYKIENQATLINQITEKLTEKAFLNDLEFAKWWLEIKIQSQLKGKKYYESKLRQKGIQPEIIKKVIKDLPSDQSSDQLENLIKKLSQQLDKRKLPIIKKKQLIYQRLLYRGFTYQEIGKQIDEILDKE